MDKPKQRITRITAEELKIFAAHLGELGYPIPLVHEPGEWWADADELRAWRSARETSGEPK